jgi:hypothetical protein
MDRIYSEAQATIIAVAGDDPTYGLPGVSNRPRKPQGCVRIGDISLVQVFRDPSASVTSSAWNKRAWTFQEGILSRRKLLFTDRQVSFLCEDMFRVECISAPQSAGLMNADITELLPRGLKRWPSILLYKYTMRSLSYDADALNACLGVLKSIDEWNHIWGVPFAIGSHKFPLGWYHQKPARRREGFPSWSWAGWETRIDIRPFSYVDKRCEFQILGVDYRTIATHNGIRTGLPKFDTPDTRASKILEATSYTFPVQLLRERADDGQQITLARVPISEDIFQLFKIHMDEDTDIQHAYALAIQWSKAPLERIRTALVVRQDSEGVYSRIGIMVELSDFTRYHGLVDINGREVITSEEDLIRRNLASLWPVEAKWSMLPIG